MKRVSLAPGHEISPIINGGWQLSTGHRVDPADRRKSVDGLVRLAQAGLTTFDCADIYTGVEELLGEVRAAYRAAGGDPNDLQFHTKFVPDESALERVDREYVTRIVDRSLMRLGVERLDLVQFHWWDYEIPGAIEAAGILRELQRAGKIRSLGVTNFNSRELARLLEAGIPIISAQVQYSLLDRRPELALIDLCRMHGTQLLCYGSLAGGFLSDRYAGVPTAPDELPNRSLVKYRLIIDEAGGWTAFQDLLATAGEIAQRHGVSRANVATRYVLQKPHVAGVIVGARTGAYLADTLRVFDFQLDPDEMNRLDAAVPARVPGDCFDLERVPEGPHRRIMKTNLNA